MATTTTGAPEAPVTGPPAALSAPHDAARDAHGLEPTRPQVSFYIYEAPVRLWHWATAVLVAVLSVTGYLIGSPPPSVAGDTGSLFVVGSIREWHFIAAWLLAIGLLWRAYWAIVGGSHARQIYWVPFWKRMFWMEMLNVLRWYLFIDRQPHRWVAHNPLARTSMVLMFTGGATFMALSGFALYGEQLGTDSWVSKAFGWMISLAGSSFTLRYWHHLGMYVLVLFSVAHIYAAFRDDVMGRVSTISSMVSGWRSFRDFRG